MCSTNLFVNICCNFEMKFGYLVWCISFILLSQTFFPYFPILVYLFFLAEHVNQLKLTNNLDIFLKLPLLYQLVESTEDIYLK